MSMVRRFAVASIFPLLSTAAPALADDQSYLQHLRNEGINTNIWPHGPSRLVMIGHMICDNLRRGADPFTDQSPLDRAYAGDVAVAAAQQELCPDTLASPEAPESSSQVPEPPPAVITDPSRLPVPNTSQPVS